MKTTDKKAIVEKLEAETKRTYAIRTTLFKDGESKQISETIYREPFVTLTVEEADRILAMLKEQEAIMIKTVMINGSGRNGRCQNCLMMLNEMDYPNFCGNCGQAVKWYE